MTPFTRSRLVEMVERGQVPLGIQCFTGDHALIEVLGRTGFDWVMLDTEHCGQNPRAIEDAVRAADGVGLVPIVRIPEASDGTAVRRSLEAGAQGLIVPMVKSAADVDVVHGAAYFPPQGNRGICPAVRAGGYSFLSFPEYAAWNNENVLIIPLIEHPTAIENIEEICAHPSVRMVTFGAGDLAYAMGESTQMLGSPRVQEAYRKVLSVAKSHGVSVIGGPVLTPTAEACAKALEDGIEVFCLGLDVMAFRSWCEDTVAALDKAVASSAKSRPVAPASGFTGK
jgi:2-keto-3-deoxy-L-rhamnonate aldolase RhmA